MKVNKGYVLQDNIKKSCEKQDILFYRFKDSPFSFANSDKTKFTTNNICDCMMFLANKLLFVELKSTKGKSFSFTEHSLRQLNDINKIIHSKNGYKRFNVYVCFVIDFMDLEKKYFIEVQYIIKNLKENNNKTINKKKYKEVGKYIKIDQEILRKNYRYDIRKLFIELGGKDE